MSVTIEQGRESNRGGLQGVVQALAVGMLVCLLLWSGSFDIISGVVYDLSVRYSFIQSPPNDQVLLILAEPEELESEHSAFAELQTNLLAFGARQILYSNLPPHHGSAFYDEAHRSGRVWFGREISFPDGSSTPKLADWPAWLEHFGLNSGLVAIPPATGGVHRRQNFHHQIDGQWLPSLTLAAAQDVRTIEPAEPTFLVNFYGLRERLPVVRFDQAMAGGLVRSMVENRSVVIGMTVHPSAIGLATPLGAGNDELIPLGQYQAAALSTLLEAREIKPLAFWIQAVMILAVALVFVVIYANVSVRSALWLTVIATVGWLSLCWITPHFFLLWPPVVPLIICQLLVMTGALYRQATENDRALRNMYLSLADRLQGRLVLDSFYHATEPWPHVVALVEQTLNLNWVIFLERIPGDHRLREIAALNCSVDSIIERRRDYLRAPYSIAIAEKGPIRLKGRYLQSDVESGDESQFLAPIMFGEEVIGFWGFGASDEVIHSSENFFAIAREYSSQISILLYQHQAMRSRRQTERRGPIQRLIWGRGDRVFRGLRDSIAMTERRLSALENVLQGMSTAIVLYDLFGRLLHINTEMENLLKALEIPGYDLNGLDLICRLTGMEKTHARQVLQRVSLDRESVALVVTAGHGIGRYYRLRLRAVEFDSDSKDFGHEESTPFHVAGVLFEVIDVTELRALNRPQKQLVERVLFQMCNDMESMVLAADLLSGSTLSAERQERVVGLLREKITDTVGFVELAQRHLQTDVSIEKVDSYPVEAKQPLLTAVDEVAELAETKLVEMAIEAPTLVSLVQAAPNELEGVLESFLVILVQDAVENSVIEVSLVEAEERVQYRLKNQGFGIPNNHLQNYLFGEQAVSAREFRQLREAIGLIEAWQGTVEASSDVGQGMEFVIELRRFI